MPNPLDDENFRIPVTRTEFEALEGGIRWSVWDGDELRLMKTFRFDDLVQMRRALETTRILLTSVAEDRLADRA